MGLYDNYKQTNSNQIYKYAGAPIAEMEKVGSALQQSYETNKDAYDVYAQSVKDAKIYSGDKQLFASKMDEHKKAIEEAAKAGNYEDMSSQVRRQGRKLASDYRPFADNLAQINAENKDLNEGLNTKYNKDFVDMAMRARSAYKGLKDNGDGTYSNQYMPKTFAKNVKVDDEILAGLKALPMHKLTKSGISGTISQEGGTYFITNEQSREKIESERIAEVVQRVMASPEVKSYKEQYYNLKYAPIEGVTANDLKGEDSIIDKKAGKVLTFKGQVGAYAAKNNVSFNEAYKAVAAKQAFENDISNTTKSYIKTNTVNNISDKTKMGQETANSKDARKAAAKDSSFQFEGAVSQNKERSFSDISDGIKANKDKLAVINQKLAGTLSQIDRDHFETEKASLSESIAQDSGMLANNADDVLADIQPVIKGVKVFKGLKAEDSLIKTLVADIGTMNLTKAAIKKALVAGNVQKVNGKLYIPTDQGLAEIAPENSFKNHAKDILKKFASIADLIGGTDIAGQIGESTNSGMVELIDKLGKAPAKLENLTATNSSHSQTTSHIDPFTPKQSTEISNNFKSNPNNYEVYKDGKLVKNASDYPDLKFTALSTNKGGSNNTRKLEAYSTKSGDNAHYTVVGKGNNNIASVMAARSENAKSYSTPLYYAIKSAEINAPVSIGTPKELKTADGKSLGIATHIVKTESANGNFAYYFRDKNNKNIQHPDGGDIYEKDDAKVMAILNHQ